MTTVVAYTMPFDMREDSTGGFELGEGEVTAVSESGATVRFDNGFSASIGWSVYSTTVYVNSIAYYDGGGTAIMALSGIGSRLSIYSGTSEVTRVLSVPNLLRGDDTIVGAQFDDYIIAYAGSDAVYSGAGNDYVRGEAGNDFIATQEGNDVILPGSGSDTVDGWTGLDTVVVSGSSSSYTVTRSGESVRLRGSYETDTLTHVERIQFDNGTMVVSQNDPAFTVHRLYGAAFGRVPEAAGLHGWTQQLQGGLADRDMAAYLAASQEFAMRYGNPGNAEFVRLCYANVLGRDPSASESQGWVQALDGGSLSRSDVLLGFANSAENVAATTARTGDALWLG